MKYLNQDDIKVINKFLKFSKEEEMCLPYLCEPFCTQYNGPATLRGGLKSIEKDITSISWYKGDIIIKTNLYYASGSTSKFVALAGSNKWSGNRCLKLYIKDMEDYLAFNHEG
jgi:hypothetical protein